MRAYVHFQDNRVAVTLSRKYDPQASYPGCDRHTAATTISFDAYGWHMPDVALVLSQFSAVFCTVVHLELDAELEESAYSDDAYDVEWLRLLRQFPAMRSLYVYLKLAPAVFLALEDIAAETVAEVFPFLDLILLEGEPASSLEKIVAIRRFSDHPITIAETTDEFNERLVSYVSR